MNSIRSWFRKAPAGDLEELAAVVRAALESEARIKMLPEPE
jgi:hypothetical protein